MGGWVGMVYWFTLGFICTAESNEWNVMLTLMLLFDINLQI